MNQSVLLVDPDSLVRSLLGEYLAEEGFRVWQTGSVVEAMDLGTRHDPDGIVTELSFGAGVNGLDVAAALLRQAPGRGLLFLTALPDFRFTGHRPGRLVANAAYLHKPRIRTPDTVRDALHAALTGRVPRSFRHDLAPDRPVRSLTFNQITLLSLVARGYTNRQIAELRGSSVRAVESAVGRIIAAAGIDPTRSNARVDIARLYFSACPSIAFGQSR